MQKGQVSFDLILAVIVALIFIAGLQVVSGNLKEVNTRASVRNQEKLIAMDIYRIASSSRALQDGSFTVEYKTPKIIVPGKDLPEACTINLSAGTVSYDLEIGTTTETISVEIPDFYYNEMTTEGISFQDADGTQITEIECGEKLVITNE